MSKRSKKAESSFSTGMFAVEGRLFMTRSEALAYGKAQRISAIKIGLVPPPKGVDLDVLKLSVREEWKLHVLFHGDATLMVFMHATKSYAFAVSLAALVDLVSTVKARVRELAKGGEL